MAPTTDATTSLETKHEEPFSFLIALCSCFALTTIATPLLKTTSSSGTQIRMKAIACLGLALAADGWETTAFRTPPPHQHRQSASSSSSPLFALHAQSNTDNEVSTISFDSIPGKRVLVVGGSGRVGGSVVTQLVKRGAHVTVGGTNEESFLSSQARWEQTFGESFSTKDVDFVKLDRENAESVASALQKNGVSSYDLVVHTAGPFQGKVDTPNGVIEASIDNGVPYVDVCDDYCTATAAKTKFGAKATEKNVPAIVSTGCWPGVSSLMAKQLTLKALASNKELKPEDLTVDFGFFTAGSGGAGSILLVATFLILAEEALTIVKSRRTPVKAMKDYSTVNFGSIVGDKPIAHLNLLETASV